MEKWQIEGSSLVLEKNDSEDCCGDQEERSSDIVFHVIFDILGIYCHYADIKIKIKIKISNLPEFCKGMDDCKVSFN